MVNKIPQIRRDSFMTFRPKIDMIKLDIKLSPLLKDLVDRDKDLNKMSYGIGIYRNMKKVWLAPFGSQPEYVKSLMKGDKFPLELTGIPRENGMLHYVGYFPETEQHQIYYYLGKDERGVDKRLHGLNADYYGTSKTYDKHWNVLKENSYAVRIPFDEGNLVCKKEFPQIKKGEITGRYINLSYRQLLNNKSENECTLSWLLHDTQK